MSTGLNIYDICHLSVRDILRLDGNARNRKKTEKEYINQGLQAIQSLLAATPFALVRKMVSVDQWDRTNWQALRLRTINRKSVG
ncbi:hypothetical protein PSI07_22505 [Pseudoalteromonas sp. GABNS16A]|nr:hypothetical protein [Pseudoalteromonas sp. GABNS16A]MDC9575801.1 hypothetical protein [Pseudoalteromonas sp. GABNS16A]